MSQQDFKTFASGSGASVVSQAEYAANTTLLSLGYQVGVANELLCNKTWRQSSIIAAVIADYIQAKTNQDVIDDGSTATLLAQLGAALSLQGYVADTSGTVNVLTGTITPAPALQNGLIIAIKPANSSTGIATLNLNGLGAFSINTTAGPLTGGELIIGEIYQLAYIAASNSWLLLNYQTTAPTVSSVDNSNKIATTAWVTNAGYAQIASPIFSGNPRVPTAGVGDSTTTAASTAFVTNAVNRSISSGTRMLFAQPSAPVGWTQDVSDTASNRMLRVVSSPSGNSVGGLHDPTYCNVVAAHTHAFVTGNESVLHTHADAGHRHTYAYKAGTQPQSGNSTQCWWADTTQNTGIGYANLGTESALHTHSGSTDNGSSATMWQPKYCNIIICQKN